MSQIKNKNDFTLVFAHNIGISQVNIQIDGKKITILDTYTQEVTSISPYLDSFYYEYKSELFLFYITQEYTHVYNFRIKKLKLLEINSGIGFDTITYLTVFKHPDSSYYIAHIQGGIILLVYEEIFAFIKEGVTWFSVSYFPYYLKNCINAHYIKNNKILVAEKNSSRYIEVFSLLDFGFLDFDQTLQQNITENIQQFYSIKLGDEQNKNQFLFYTTNNQIIHLQDLTIKQQLLKECSTSIIQGQRGLKTIQSVIHIDEFSGYKYIVTFNIDGQMYLIELNDDNLIIRAKYLDLKDEMITMYLKGANYFAKFEIYDIQQQNKFKIQIQFYIDLFVMIYIDKITFNLYKKIVYSSIEPQTKNLFFGKIRQDNNNNYESRILHYLENGIIEEGLEYKHGCNNDKYFAETSEWQQIIRISDIINNKKFVLEVEETIEYGNHQCEIFQESILFHCSNRQMLRIYDLTTKTLKIKKKADRDFYAVYTFPTQNILILKSSEDYDIFYIIYEMSTLTQIKSIMLNYDFDYSSFLFFQNHKNENILMISCKTNIIGNKIDLIDYQINLMNFYKYDATQEIQIQYINQGQQIGFTIYHSLNTQIFNKYFKKDPDNFNLYNQFVSNQKIQFEFSLKDDFSFNPIHQYIKQNQYYMLNHEIYPNFVHQMYSNKFVFENKVQYWRIIEPSLIFTIQIAADSKESIELIQYVYKKIIFSYSFISRCPSFQPTFNKNIQKIIICDELKVKLINISTYKVSTLETIIKSSTLYYFSLFKPIILIDQQGILDYEKDLFLENTNINLKNNDSFQIIENNKNIYFYKNQNPEQIVELDTNSLKFQILWINVDVSQNLIVKLFKQFIVVFIQYNHQDQKYNKLIVQDYKSTLLLELNEQLISKQFSKQSYIFFEEMSYFVAQYTDSFSLYRVSQQSFKFVKIFIYKTFNILSLRSEYLVLCQKINFEMTIQFVSLASLEVKKVYKIQNAHYQKLLTYLQKDTDTSSENISILESKDLFIYYNFIFSINSSIILTFYSDKIMYDDNLDVAVVVETFYDGSQFCQILDFSELFPLDFSKNTIVQQLFPQSFYIDNIRLTSQQQNPSSYITFYDHYQQEFKLFDTISNQFNTFSKYPLPNKTQFYYQVIIALQENNQSKEFMSQVNFIGIFKDVIIYFSENQSIVLETLNQGDNIIYNSTPNWESLLLKSKNILYEVKFEKLNQNEYILKKQKIQDSDDQIVVFSAYNKQYICYLDSTFKLVLISETSKKYATLDNQGIRLFEICSIQTNHFLVLGKQTFFQIYDIISGSLTKSLDGFIGYIRKFLVDEELKKVYVFDKYYCYIYRYTSSINDIEYLQKFQIQTRGSFIAKKLDKNILSIVAYTNIYIHYINDSAQLIYKIINNKFRGLNQAFLVTNSYLILADSMRVYIFDLSHQLSNYKLIQSFDLASFEIKKYKIIQMNYKQFLEIIGVNFEIGVKINIEVSDISRNKHPIPDYFLNVCKYEQNIKSENFGQYEQINQIIKYSAQEIIIKINNDNQIIYLPEALNYPKDKRITTHLIYDLNNKKTMISGQLIIDNILSYKSNIIDKLTFKNGIIANEKETQHIKLSGFQQISFQSVKLQNYNLTFQNVTSIQFDDVQFDGNSNWIQINEADSQNLQTDLLSFKNVKLLQQMLTKKFIKGFNINNFEFNTILTTFLDYKENDQNAEQGFIHIQDTKIITLQNLIFNIGQIENKLISIHNSQNLIINTLKIINPDKKKRNLIDQNNQNQDINLVNAIIDINYISKKIQISNIELLQLKFYTFMRIQDTKVFTGDIKIFKIAQNLQVEISSISFTDINPIQKINQTALFDIQANQISIKNMNITHINSFYSTLLIQKSNFVEIDKINFDNIQEIENLIYIMDSQSVIISNVFIDNSNLVGYFIFLQQTVANINNLQINTKTNQQNIINVKNAALSIQFVYQSLQTPLKIENSKILKMTTQNHIFEFRNVQKIQITNVQFKENYSMMNGGAITASNSYLIFNGVQFISNQADLSGGALYLEESQIDVLDTQHDTNGLLIKTLIQNNYAYIGGGMRYFNLVQPNFLKNNQDVFKNNSAKFYGNQYTMYPKNFIILNINDQQEMDAVSSITSRLNKVN